VNENPDVINSIIKKLKFDFVQLCGEEKIKDIKKIRSAKIIKVIRPKNKKDMTTKIKKYEKYIDYFLIDTYKKGFYGGTGEKFNWDFINIIKKSKKPYFVAGGITPENIGELLIKYKPYGIDINSGIEKSYGKKSIKKLKLLFKNIFMAIDSIKIGAL
jgi:phosphoribosylanthranilate isomerase